MNVLRLVLATALLWAAGAAAQSTSWNRADWNPKEIKDGHDFILPLPCGGAMALRMVGTSGAESAAKNNQLDDRQVLLGSTDDEQPASGYLHTEFIAGSFKDNTNAHYYLLGKYEVTNQQYDSVMGTSCDGPKPDRAGYPKGSVNWYEAVEFTHRLNVWLYQKQPAALPKASGRPGFVRLPTEAEWEFAVRGGLAVGDAERGNRTPIPGGANISEYAWSANPESAAGLVQAIGALKPNPLGLFDMLGNIEEIVLEPFRFNRVGRLHGQPGGMVVRGGSFRTPKESLRSSSRTELPLFDPAAGKELRFPQVGFRVAIGALAFNDLTQADALQREWTSLRKSSSEAGATADPLKVLETMAHDSTNPEQRRQLREIIAQIGTDARARGELEARAIKGLWAHAVTMRGNVLASAGHLDGWKKVMDERDTGPATAARRTMASQQLAAELTRFNSSLSTYLDLVIQLATGFPGRDVGKEAALLRRELELLGDLPQIAHLDEAVKLVTLHQQNAQMRDTRAMRRATVGERSWLPR